MLKQDELASPHSCLNRARPDEMLFVLLGRDPAAAVAVEAWIAARLLIGKNREGDPQIVEARQCLATLRAQATARLTGTCQTPIPG